MSIVRAKIEDPKVILQKYVGLSLSGIYNVTRKEITLFPCFPERFRFYINESGTVYKGEELEGNDHIKRVLNDSELTQCLSLGYAPRFLMLPHENPLSGDEFLSTHECITELMGIKDLKSLIPLRGFTVTQRTLDSEPVYEWKSGALNSPREVDGWIKKRIRGCEMSKTHQIEVKEIIKHIIRSISLETKVGTVTLTPTPPEEVKVECEDSKRLQAELANSGQTALGLAMVAADKAAKRSRNDRELAEALQTVKSVLDLDVSLSTRFRPTPAEKEVLPLVFMINNQTTDSHSNSIRAKEMEVIHFLANRPINMSTYTEKEKKDICLFAMGCCEEKSYKDKYWPYVEMESCVYQEHRRLMFNLINKAVAAANGVPFETLAQEKGFNPILLALDLQNPQLVRTILMTSFHPKQVLGSGRLDTPLMTAIKYYAAACRHDDRTHAELWLGIIDTFLNRWKEMVNQPGASFSYGGETRLGGAPLGVAIEYNLPEIVTKLLEKGASPDLPYSTRNEYGHVKSVTPLQHAFQLTMGNYPRINYNERSPSIDSSPLIIPLLQHGAKNLLEESKTPNETPIGVVIAELCKKELKDEAKKANLVKIIHAFLTQPERVKSWLAVPQGEYECETLLGDLLLSGNIELAKKLILAGAPLGQTFKLERYNHEYPLQYACELEDIDLINLMLARPYEQYVNKDGHFDYFHRRNIFLYGGVRSRNETVFRTLVDSPKFECVTNSPELCDEMLNELVASKSLSRISYLLARFITLTQKSAIQVITFIKEMMNASKSLLQFDQARECLSHLMICLPRKENKLDLSNLKLIIGDLASLVNPGRATVGAGPSSSSSSSSSKSGMFGGIASNVVENHKEAKTTARVIQI